MSTAETAAVVAAVEVSVVVLAVTFVLAAATAVGMGVVRLLIVVDVCAATVLHHYGHSWANLLITACGLNLG